MPIRSAFARRRTAPAAPPAPLRATAIAAALALATVAAPAHVHAEADTGASPPELAPANHTEISVGGAARALRSPSANALTGANLAGGSFGVARDLGLALHPRLSLWLEAGLTTGSAHGTMFQSLSTSIETYDLTAGLAARYRIFPRLTASARVALGAQRVRVAIDPRTGPDAGGDEPPYDHAWGALATAGVAVDAFALAHPPFGLGVRVEAGYVAARPFAVTLHVDPPDDAITLAMTSAALGHLDLSGPSVSVSLLGQF
jgi:hypothetical protein